MALTKQQRKKIANLEPRIVNRRAKHDYEILESLETGIVLQGSEVKSVRAGRVSLADGYATVDPNTMELYLHNVDIALYPQAGPHHNHAAPKQKRKLLAHKQEIRRLMGKTTQKGVTLVPLQMYFVNGRVKVEIGVAQGKKSFDKRDSIKEREMQRDMDRAMTRRVI